MGSVAAFTSAIIGVRMYANRLLQGVYSLGFMGITGQLLTIIQGVFKICAEKLGVQKDQVDLHV